MRCIASEGLSTRRLHDQVRAEGERLVDIGEIANAGGAVLALLADDHPQQFGAGTDTARNPVRVGPANRAVADDDDAFG